MNYDKLIYDIAIKRGLPDSLALNLVAQSRHETKDYTSGRFLNLNNAFGYGYVKGNKRQSGRSNPVKKPNIEPVYFAAYKNVEDSVNDVIDYLNNRKREGKFSLYTELGDTSNYAENLKKWGYYTAPFNLYLNALQTAKSKIDLTEDKKKSETKGILTEILIGVVIMLIGAFILKNIKKF